MDANRDSSPAWADNDEIDLAEYIDLLWSGKWIIVATTLVFGFIGVLFAVLATPVYQTDLLVQVEEEGASAMGGLDELSSLFGSEAASVTEIEVLRSRHVVGRAVDALGLDTPISFVSNPLTAWIDPGYELSSAITVGRFEPPASLIGESFELMATESGYLLSYEGKALAESKVGVLLELPIAESMLRLFVAQLDVEVGTQFAIAKEPWPKAVATLQQRLHISEKGKNTGVIRLTLEGEDRARITQILQTVGNIYVRQNVERRSAEAGQSLEFLDGQLPALRTQLDAAEISLNNYLQANKTVDLSAETQSILARLVDIEQQQSGLGLKRAELEQRFGAQHPSMVVLTDQSAELDRLKDELEEQVSHLPATQQDILRLTRDVEVNSALYTYLLNKAQELRVIKAGTVGNVRILDNPVMPYEAIKPKKPLIVAVAILLGGFLGIAIILVRQAMRRGISDPAELEKRLGLPLYSVVPFSEEEAMFTRKRKKGERKLLARENGKDLAIEALRGMRTSLHFAMMETDNNRVMISGASPGVGKSFLSINLGYLLAEAGKRVLVIDADMRKGHLNQYIGAGREMGLSELIAGQCSVEEAIKKPYDDKELSVIATGEYPPNPSELLLSDRFPQLLEQLGSQFDIVLIDTPPIMAVADAGIVAPHAGATFIVVRAEVNRIDEVEVATKRLSQHGSKVSGFLFNGLRRSSSSSSYGKYSYYQYDYK